MGEGIVSAPCSMMRHQKLRKDKYFNCDLKMGMYHIGKLNAIKKVNGRVLEVIPLFIRG